MSDSIELDNLDKREEEQNRENEEDDDGEDDIRETSLLDDDDDVAETTKIVNKSITTQDGSNPDFRGNVRQNLRKLDSRRYFQKKARTRTERQKEMIKEVSGYRVIKGAGPYSSQLFVKMNLSPDLKGIIYKGKKIIIFKNGQFAYSENKAILSTVNEFKELVNKAHQEYSKTIPSKIDEVIDRENLERDDSYYDLEQSIRENSFDKIQEKLDENSDIILNDPTLNDNELREFRGILAKEVPDNADDQQYKLAIEALDVEIQHWNELAENDIHSNKQKLLYKTIADTAELKADQFRLRLNLLPEGELAKSILEEEIETNDLTRFQRFKKWAKSNLGGISLAAITIAGIVTSVVIVARSGIEKGAHAAGKVGKALYNVGKKLGPLVGAALGLIGKILTLGAVGLSWLSQNIWVLFLALIFFCLLLL